jgi:hypothetical protein
VCHESEIAPDAVREVRRVRERNPALGHFSHDLVDQRHA